jgi:UDPglucose--hexose-1-phosphate uridylyltransferase
MNPALDIERLIAFGLYNGLIAELDAPMARNALLNLMRLDKPYIGKPADIGTMPYSAFPILESLLSFAVDNGIIEHDTVTERDLFDTKLMGCLMPRPSEVACEFEEMERARGAQAACDWFYDFCVKCGYIRAERIAKDIAWTYKSKYGKLDITINQSKPEKDPRVVALQKDLPQNDYPQCMLCASNVGYAGRLDYPARQTLRVIPMKLNGEQWYFQFSPYVYYLQHCIVLRDEHSPMKITKETFVRMLEFEERFPHYFIGANAGLPIVGGSILNHDHFQGGAWRMPMARAEAAKKLKNPGWPSLSAEILKWPMPVLRLRHRDRFVLAGIAAQALEAWESYSDLSLGIQAYTGKEPHNAVTPIARRRGPEYELDLVLRNNRADDAHPYGIFHPHAGLHHIKKENIGLIEVMGLFVLPGRLAQEFSGLAKILCGQEPFDKAALAAAGHPLHKHLPWLESLLSEYKQAGSYDEAMGILKEQCGEKCAQVLDDCGVFKDSEEGMKGFTKFLKTAGYMPA